MWSKKRRKSKKEKEKRSQPPSPSKMADKGIPLPMDRPHPLTVEHQAVHPPNTHTYKNPPNQLLRKQPPPIHLGGKSAISVPLPSAPLNTDILDSIANLSGGDDRGNPPRLPVPGNPEVLQKVIDRQRSQIELLSQITRLVSGSTLPPSGGDVPSSVLPSRLASRAQTYDYGNRSNKTLEEKALQELDRGYLEEKWN